MKDARRRIAWWISILFHPFALVPFVLMWMLSRTMAPARAMTISVLIAAATVIPLLLFIRRRVRQGTWSDHDVSTQAERPALYAISIILTFLTGLVLHLSGESSRLSAGAWNLTGMLIAAAIINLRIKASLHSAFAMWFAVVVWNEDHVAGVVAFAIVACLAWSRLELKRHTPLEVATGLALGLIAVVLLIW